MNKRSHVRAVGAGSEAHTNSDATLELNSELEEESPEDEQIIPDSDEFFEDSRRSFGWILPALGLLALAAWTGFFVWAKREELLAGNSPQQWIDLVGSWAVPVLLIVCSWLLAARSSTREATRFGNAARLLSMESQKLEQRLATVNRELSLAREFLASQTRELDYLGRSATERISEHADRLQSLVQDNGQQIDSISRASISALENMNKLRDDLPVIANSARDVSNQIGGAGRTAKGQLAELVSGFERLNEFGQASERQVQSLRQRVDEALKAFTSQAGKLQQIAEARFTALREESETYRSELDSREVEALAAMRGRAESTRSEIETLHQRLSEHEEAALASIKERTAQLLGEAEMVSREIRESEETAQGAWKTQLEAVQAGLQDLASEADAAEQRQQDRSARFEAEIAKRREALTSEEGDALARVEEQLAALDREIETRRQGQIDRMEQLARQGEALGAKISEFEGRVGEVAAQGREAEGVLSSGIASLSEKLAESRSSLDGTHEDVASLTDASVRLLELIQAAAKHGNDELPTSLDTTERRLREVEARAEALQSVLADALQSGETLDRTVDDARKRSISTITGIEELTLRLSGSMDEQGKALEQLQSRLKQLDTDSDALSKRAQSELRDAIGALETSARSAIMAIETDQAGHVRRIAESVGKASADAIGKAVEEETGEALSNLQEATNRATASSRDAIVQLRDQLAKVNELAGNLESRIAHARDRAEEQVDSDFSRRVALITESLNSNAIDIAKVLSTDVTDTAWASYLRGDRGIFTRRSVRLLDNTEARDIAELYDSDGDFREHVSRYIHDFEAMLRTMLSTRDGHAVGVTLLSSDMGKLYVALAQAIERLRA